MVNGSFKQKEPPKILDTGFVVRSLEAALWAFHRSDSFRAGAMRANGMPTAVSSAMCSFPSVEAAVNTAIQTIQEGVPVARIELANAAQMDAINKYSKLELPVAPTLWLEFHGSEASVEEQARIVQMIACDHGGADFSWTANPKDRVKLWRARHDVAYADRALRPGAQIWATDVCVPISRIAECIIETEKDIAASFLLAPISWVMSATAISTWSSCSIRTSRRKWRRRNGSISG
jgi:FAD/FMN-containing dehydrogenase